MSTLGYNKGSFGSMGLASKASDILYAVISVAGVVFAAGLESVIAGKPQGRPEWQSEF